ncbi:hypothetical protein [Erythrobacter tepidarius]|uniref:hypothetical protein n=1 Tax=Erythrobacter tepidarius TaxID=60454 RepID=UPI000A3BA0FB|nr:hypothetical protein [Erythrobacter tepidarius]
MAIRGSSRRALPALIAALALLALGGCDAAPAASTPDQRPELGLMTSLPLYWQADAELADIAAGRAIPPWQRRAIETRFVLVPLDTLSPVPALSPDAPDTDPLAGLARLAVIQPRGLAPADNVALDAWVRRGGRLLLVLDPMLTGEYDGPLGDPRRPVDSALVPPVVARWGLAISFDAAQQPQVTQAPLGEARLPLVLAGRIALTDAAAGQCRLLAGAAAASCAIGKGRATLIADAALFEHPELAGAEGEVLLALLSSVFD